MGTELHVVGAVATADVPPVPSVRGSAAVPRLLWGWTEVIRATNIPLRTLQKELSAGRFPRPTRQVGRRPYWSPQVIEQWAAGDSGNRKGR